MISVTDTGTGMEDLVREKVFEPFFSTKENDEKNGLGLASSYGTVKTHNGTIEVFSEVGKGSTFNIYLPYEHKFSPNSQKAFGIL